MSVIRSFNPGFRAMSFECNVAVATLGVFFCTLSLSFPPLQVKRSRDLWQRSPTTPTSMIQTQSLSSPTQTEGTVLTSPTEEET